MSDLRSATLLAAKTKKGTTVNPVNINTVLQKVLQQLTTEERNKINLRCDDLPFALGLEEDFEVIFSGLVQMILQKKQSVPKLFLHINCAADSSAATAEKGLKQYNIQFNTNIDTCFNWMQQNEQQLANITTLLHNNEGSLVVNQVKGSGCIFSLSLPGK